MALTKWLPWKFIIRRAAKAYGFIDPVTIIARLRRFGHPSEVHEPIELMRAGVVFHARGLVNTRAIQYNLDWVWPYWIVKQFKPTDASFIPRGFSFSHVNLTHRNWTAVGQPGIPFYPVVDPRGLITPYWDGWSIDFWIVSSDHRRIVPAETENVQQRLNMDDNQLSVTTRTVSSGFQLETTVWVEKSASGWETCIRARASADTEGRLVLGFRPYNPEGVQFIDKIEYRRKPSRFTINQRSTVKLNPSPVTVLLSDYQNGDAAGMPAEAEPAASISCDIGMATSAALFPIGKDQPAEVNLSLPLIEEAGPAILSSRSPEPDSGPDWQTAVAQTARLGVPDPKIQFLYDAAVRTLILLRTEDEVYPGPYTYKRFWFRDACLMIHAMLGIGLDEPARKIIQGFPARQNLSGYFQSQEGEWDSNGQVLWITARLQDLTDREYPESLRKSLFKGADWIIHKRIRKDPEKPHHGLLPAGFSAEHLGPNDYYYWDNFWGLAGLEATARLACQFRSDQEVKAYKQAADDFRQRIFASIAEIPDRWTKGAIPASPYRRMDAGAIGSLVADYPLQLVEPNRPMIMKTIAYLQENCFHSGAFFQDMIHSGINVYLTLAIAQTFLRSGNPAYRELIRTVADLASPTGQWPEAIHPFTGGGCMGDGQHGWAAAEWLMMIRNLFVREEGNKIIIGSGIFPEWIETGEKISFGPTLVPAGRIQIGCRKTGESLQLEIRIENQRTPLEIHVDVPGYESRTIRGIEKSAEFRLQKG